MTKKFTCSTVSQAPESPGLYAWYSKVDIGDSDYVKQIFEGKDEGATRFRASLARHTGRHNLPDMHVHIHSSFESEWKATISELTTERFVETLYGNPPVDEQAEQGIKKRLAALDKSFETQKTRQLFKRILEDSVPIFASPIYIGVSDNLRRRLTEHVQYLQRLARALDREPQQREDLRRSASQSGLFAARALAAGFDENLLEVHIQDFSEFAGGEFTVEQLRDIAGSAEWVLNRWHKPYLGRR